MARVVDDFALIGPTAGAALADRLRTLEAGSGAELIVMAVPAVSRRAFREHAVGARRIVSERPERSILLVVATGDRHVEIATAPRFARHFPPAATALLLQGSAVPHLRSGDLPGALEAGMAAVVDALAAPPPPPEHTARPRPALAAAIIVLAVLLAGGFVAWRIVHRADYVAGSSWGGSHGGDSGSSDSGWSSGSDSSSGSSDSGSSDGGGGADY